jgi:hypothetical protein
MTTACIEYPRTVIAFDESIQVKPPISLVDASTRLKRLLVMHIERLHAPLQRPRHTTTKLEQGFSTAIQTSPPNVQHTQRL